jgi:hypothetical protein
VVSLFLALKQAKWEVFILSFWGRRGKQFKYLETETIKLKETV